VRNPLLSHDAWTVVHDEENDTVHVIPNRLRLPSAPSLLVFPGAGFTPTQAAWRLPPRDALLRVERAASA
jgi:hypothetical protein